MVSFAYVYFRFQISMMIILILIIQYAASVLFLSNQRTNMISSSLWCLPLREAFLKIIAWLVSWKPRNISNTKIQDIWNEIRRKYPKYFHLKWLWIPNFVYFESIINYFKFCWTLFQLSDLDPNRAERNSTAQIDHGTKITFHS